MNISKELKAGIIALIAIVGFVLLFQFMKGKNLFTTDNVFYAKYDNVEGLERSSAVSINGLKVGQVDKIMPITDKDGKIHFIVKITVDDSFKFSKKSTLEIFEPGLMSGKELRVNLAYGGEEAKDGDTLQGGFKLSMLSNLGSQVGPVKDQLQVVLHRVDSLMMSANQIVDEQNRAEIRALLANLNKTVGSLEGTSGSVNSLVEHNDPKLQRVLDNAKCLAKELEKRGFRIVSGGTDNHTVLVDLRAKKITGKQFDQTLEKIGITVNKNTIPNDPESPFVTSGVSIGLTAVSERGFGANDIAEIADIMEKVADNIENDKVLEECKKQARDLISRFPLYPEGYFED